MLYEKLQIDLGATLTSEVPPEDWGVGAGGALVGAGGVSVGGSVAAGVVGAEAGTQHLILSS